jgi:arylsulfatase A-like enzyme
MADDLGYGDFSCYNAESKIQTPNIDRLAKEGMRFTDAHSPAAICTPTRYALITGRYTWRGRLKRGVFGGYNYPLIEEGRMTFASLLKENGYGTACLGKWHIGLHWGVQDGVDHGENENYNQDIIDFSKPLVSGPNEVGFDYFFGTAGCTTDDPPVCYIENHNTVGIPTVMAALDTAFEDREMLMVPGFKHEEADTDFTKGAIEFMEKHRESRPYDPFFIYLPLSIPHVPWLPPAEFSGTSEEGPRGDQVVLFDWCVGQLMESLDRLGVADNTLIVVSSDNGPRQGRNGHDSSGGLRGGKGSIYEGGHRVPFVVRWPARVQAGVTSDALTTFTDMMATFAAIVGADLPDDAGEDSFNMLPVLLGEDTKGRDMVINHTGNVHYALRRGPWKLIQHMGGRRRNSEFDPTAKGELYNLDDDPREEHDLWDTQTELGREMMAILVAQKDQGYTRSM